MTAVATVTVGTPALAATNDAGTLADGSAGGTVPGLNVATNDTLNGNPVTLGTNATITPVTAGPITVNADGSVTVAAGTPAADYPVTYELCEILNPTHCVTAVATVTVGAPANKVAGTVYEDNNSNGVFDAGDQSVGGYIIQLIRDGNVVATTTAQADGSYEFTGIPVGTGYSTAAINPQTGNVVTGVGRFDVSTGTTMTEINLPIDPSGVVYDSVTRVPVAAATLTLTSASGTTLPTACFVSPAEQPQTTGVDGRYAFNLIPGADALCPVAETEYRIRIVHPAGYVAAPSITIAPQSGTLDATTCPIDAVAGGSCEVQANNDAPQAGDATTYFLAFLLQAGDPHVVRNHIPLDPVAAVPGDVTVSKTAQSQIGIRGGSMAYTIVATNNGTLPVAGINVVDTMPSGFSLIEGSATVDGAPANPGVNGRAVTFAGLAIPAGSRVTLKLALRIPVNAAPGEYVNIAAATDPATGNQIGTSGKATIRIETEAVFDCSDVIGKVFDDRNANGYQDKGEPGIPGVRLATVNGQLITTDKNGQYHVPCAMLPDQKIGSNFILKLDTRTLPTGYHVTTENPETVRLTAGKAVKLNFGATLGRVVRLDIEDGAFEAGTTTLKPEWANGIAELVRTLSEKPSTLRLTYKATGETSALATNRVAALKKLIAKRWKQDGADYALQIETEIAK